MNTSIKEKSKKARAHKDYVLGRALKKFSALAPQSAGIYIFKDKRGEFLYIGKAANLRNRIRQYFKYKAAAPYLKYLLNEAEKVDFKTTDSEIEALILESRLIKKHQPKYNIMLRDGKQYFYVVFTKERFPKIFLTHQPTARGPAARHPHGAQLSFAHHGGPPLASPLRFIVHDYIGPFTDGAALKVALRLLRRVFPYCTCKQLHNNFCLNYHIGNCPGYCCLKKNETGIKNYELENYKRNIKAIKNILSGKKTSVVKNLKKELVALGKKQEFEKAIELRNKLEKLEKVFANAKIIHNSKFMIHDSETSKEKVNALKELKQTFKLPFLPKRIEGYDISNIQGKNAVGAMVVFSDGRPDKNEYRKFKIRRKQTPDDIAMLKEILFRRFNHPEWPSPDLILIDGGIGQLNAAIFAIANIAAFSESSKLKNLSIISLAKGKNEVFSTTLKKQVPMKKLVPEVRNLIQQIDAEAHRFAVSYYRKIHGAVIFR